MSGFSTMKKITNFKNKKVLVLGLAKSGQAAARLLNQLGAMVTVNDGKTFEENPEAQSLLAEGIKVICGSHPLTLLDENFEVVIKNPGIPYRNPMVKKALDKEIPILTEVELAYLVSEAPIIAITGSNGKTTTTTMIADILKHGGQSALLSGNIGFPASEVAIAAESSDTLVMELSSFQLMGVQAFHPHIALITNLMPSHLDYHGTFQEYVAAKWNVQNNMTPEDFVILNANQAISKELAQNTRAQVIYFSTTEKINGAYLFEGKLYYQGDYIMDADQIGVPGSHNIENALAAISVAKLSGLSNQVIAESISRFSGVKHRLQFVGAIDGVRFYNDSKSTNILACQKALSGFANEHLILIAGGLDRGNEFDELVPDIVGLKKMIVLGESAEKMKAAAEKAGVTCLKAKDVADATRMAKEVAQAGDTILLSPANASWDMYKNFEIRGEEFLSAYRDLKGDA
ncbi:UDP-N-acetylmuramoyl-L-alanyl-D-glutamate synthetase [Streptococcus iniae]|nr:UDP-N-acetylmuramoyl-L-alanyl-D-glutamate synthetase [Streptococcus iniae]ATX39325.1 UDP-N-acetylmuramoylalanine--D-glutamate ligase [Streptococcus iniae]